MDLGFGELVVIFLIVMILFGANKIPALAEGLGKAIRGVKEGMRGELPSKDEPASDAKPGEHKG